MDLTQLEADIFPRQPDVIHVLDVNTRVAFGLQCLGATLRLLMSQQGSSIWMHWILQPDEVSKNGNCELILNYSVAGNFSTTKRSPTL